MSTVKIILFFLSFSTMLFALPENDFVITVKTDNPGISANTEFTIPITRTNGNGYNVDCNNDGIDEATGITGNNSYTCIYATPNTYTIRVKDNNGNDKGFRRIQFGSGTDAQKLLEINQWGTAIWTTMFTAFSDANNTIVTASDTPDLTVATNLKRMFKNCTLADPNVSSWSVSHITNLSEMFRNASSANPDVSGWDTSLVTDFNGMFYDAVSATPVTTTWNTSSATTMAHMFHGATQANSDTSAWDTSSVTLMNSMFRGATQANPDVSGWDTSNVTNFSSMFYAASNAQPVTVTNANIWNTGSATQMDSMFRDATNANPDVSGWDTSNVTNFSFMFYKASIAQPITLTSGNVWNTSSATLMKSMFRDASNADPVVSGWNTSSVTDLNRMFLNASVANPDVSSWITSSVTSINSMFRNASLFDQNMSGWDVSQITDATNFLLGAQLTIANYDALLSSWGSQVVQTGVPFHAGTSQYCAGEGGRNVLVSNSWSITDGGKNCGGVCASAVGQLTENHWTTISFPCATGANGIEALIGTAIGGTYGDNSNWVVYEQRGDYIGTSESMVLLAATDVVEPAKGYWIISDHNTTWHIDGALGGLSYASTVTASSLGISSPNFDYVHLRNLPDTAAVEQKLLLGNPFPHDINLSDIYFSGAGAAFSPMDGNANNDPYVNNIVYTYDQVGNDQSAYQAIATSTPGFDKVIHQQGFWLRLKPGAVDTNRLTFPQVK